MKRCCDNAIPKYVPERAEAVVIIPSFMKGGGENPLLVAQWRAAIARETGARPVPTTGR